MSKKEPFIIVTGCQRSGTSLIAGILFHLGVFMGQYFIKRDINAPLGFFESLEFGDNDEGRYLEKKTKEEWKRDLDKLIEKNEQDFENAKRLGFTRWGWKNPSSALFLDDYEEYSPVIIWCEREKQANLESLKRLYGDVDWLESNYDTKQAQKRGYIIKLEQFKENTDFELGRLIQFLGIEPTEEQIKRAKNHILRKHDHRKKPEEECYLNYM